MRFHILMPGCQRAPAVSQPWESALAGGAVLDIARVADDAGFDGVLVPEHFVVGLDHARSTGTHFLDATTAQAVIAGATERLAVNSMVTLLPLHNPVVLAKSICTLDWLTGGRAALTVGLGWQRDEYDAVGVDWRRRGRIADEYLAAMIELWRSDTPEFEGEFVAFGDLVFEPKPVQRPNPPVWVGGDAPAALRRAARFGDGWAPWLSRPDQLRERIETIKTDPSFVERPFSVFYSLMSLRIGFSEGRHVAMDDPDLPDSTSPERLIDECGKLAELGVTDTWIPYAQVRDLEAFLDHLRWVAEEVVAPIRR